MKDLRITRNLLFGSVLILLALQLVGFDRTEKPTTDVGKNETEFLITASGTTSSSPPSSIIAWWPAEGNANDIVRWQSCNTAQWCKLCSRYTWAGV